MDSDLRASRTEFARGFNLTLEEYLLIVRACTAPEVTVILELMRERNPASAFRRLSQIRVRSWLSREHSIGKPLSDSDLRALIPDHPLNWSLPK